MSTPPAFDPQLPPWLNAMLDPAFYDGSVTKVQLIQTHVSWVILTGSYAYKIKKPVNFGFLDFSSLDKRREMCQKELELNRRLAPDIYLDVLPIYIMGNKFRIDSEDGNGDVIEYCLRMVQFDPHALLANEIETDYFDPRLIDELALQIAKFHLAAQPISDLRFGTSSILRKYISENLDTSLELSHYQVCSDLSPTLKLDTYKLLQRLGPRIEQRCNDGWIRTCHGDLHLGNITILNGSPCVFDCIEFNDELIKIDTMNDISFLTMDCDARNHAELSLRFLSRYLEYTGDYAGLALLRLFQSYRAGVRGKVALLLSKDSGMTKQSAKEKRLEACRYFKLAAYYINIISHPHMYVIGGVSGSGKSHLALQGSKEEGALVIRSDAIRKRLGTNANSSLYTAQMTQKTYEALMHSAGLALTAGYSVILDATFLNREHRELARELARKHCVPLHMIWLDLPASELRQRIKVRSLTESDVSDANLAVLESQLSNYPRPNEDDIHFLSSSDTWPDHITSTA